MMTERRILACHHAGDQFVTACGRCLADLRDRVARLERAVEVLARGRDLSQLIREADQDELAEADPC